MNSNAIALFGSDNIGSDLVRVIRDTRLVSALEQVQASSVKLVSGLNLLQPIERTFDVKISIIPNDVDDNDYILLDMRDITDIRSAEQIRSDFVANVSHELRSPLTALAGFIETIKGAAKNDPVAQSKFLDMMELETSRMARLISDLLSLSKVEASQHQRLFERVDMGQLTQQTIDMLQQKAKSEGKNIQRSIAGTDLTVPGSKDELTQIVINLVENAIKYSGPGATIKIEISPVDQVAGINGPAVALAVTDTGPGIARQHIPRLTERFYRVDSHRSREKGGTGLGLAIVKHIVSHHRGRLHITSTEGEGSTFTVFLPIL